MASKPSRYDVEFYDEWAPITACSAARIVPIVMELIGPRSVVDLGCGSGLWLSEFARAGVPDFAGMDGPWVKAEALAVPAERFTAQDLTLPIPATSGRYDLAMSLEVAEHLPSSAAETFVANLVSLAPVVLFSASIPNQGGVEHINEQWPGYWVDRFAGHDYVAVDAIRPLIWDVEEVAAFYKQNIGVFVHRSHLSGHPRLLAIHESTGGRFLPLVHPETYQLALDRAEDFPRLVSARFKQSLGPVRPLAARARRGLRL